MTRPAPSMARLDHRCGNRWYVGGQSEPCACNRSVARPHVCTCTCKVIDGPVIGLDTTKG